MTLLTLYSRRGCHLCEDMEQQLAELGDAQGFTIEIRDVDSEPAWLERYNDKVPLLMRGDREICRYFLDAVALREALAGPAGRPPDDP